MYLVNELSSICEGKGFEKHDAFRRQYFQINTSSYPETEDKNTRQPSK